MNITITARHYELTPALKDYAERKVYNLKRYFDHIVKAHITFSLEKYRHAVEITVHVNGKDFNSKEESEDMYASVDRVVDKLERQILKHKGKIKRYKSQRKISEIEYSYPDESQKAAEPEGNNADEVILADREEFPRLTMQEALDRMKGNGKEYGIFSNAATSKLNIIFLRKDGRVGLLEI